MGKEVRLKYLQGVRRLVVKVGSAVITAADGLNRQVIDNLSAELSRFMRQGYEVVLVSSGAIACGRRKMGFHGRSLPEKQALAAIGQSGLIEAYEEAFERYGQKVAQILLTRQDLESRQRFLNARNTLKVLFTWKVLPIVNENDTVAIEEIQFGDNDTLAALTVNLVEADLLVCLSDVDALYDQDPRLSPRARPLTLVEKIDRRIVEMAGDRPGRLGRGGMGTKIKAAQMVTSAGVPMVIAGGRIPGILERIFAGEEVGTFFVPSGRKLSSRRYWIAYNLKPTGAIIIDAGAKKALVKDGASLLPVGVKAVEGNFPRGACVECLDEEGRRVAIGLSNYSAAEIRRIIGCRSPEVCRLMGAQAPPEIIHRDNLVLAEE
ncbi:glutamate 5-kinase [Thermosulfuriphilus ammonigenes]|nr:glutamate 5-kinase [Thermosulfuriphilus ammonigenes]MBA2849470.1 glutamate 5-kinase [Thermosulfuriphilus ammonigenes]